MKPKHPLSLGVEKARARLSREIQKAEEAHQKGFLAAAVGCQKTAIIIAKALGESTSQHEAKFSLFSDLLQKEKTEGGDKKRKAIEVFLAALGFQTEGRSFSQLKAIACKEIQIGLSQCKNQTETFAALEHMGMKPRIKAGQEAVEHITKFVIHPSWGKTEFTIKFPHK